MSTTTLSAPAPAPAPALRSSRIRELLRLVDRPGVLSLAGGLPAPETLDADWVRAASDRALDRRGPLGPVALQYGPTEGVAELRAAIADRTGTRADQVLITTGSQQAIDLLARAWCEPGDVVVVEAPSYLGALQAFAAARLSVRSIAGDANGFDVDRLADALASGERPRLVYVVPNFHNPTGALLDHERRQRLAELADRFDFLLVEDDAYGRLAFGAAVPPSLASYSERVVQLGTASKILGPGLRVGWLSGPPDVIDSAALLKQAVDLHTASWNQLVVADLLGQTSELDHHLARVRALYAARATALADALAAEMGDRLSFARPQGGMFLWARTTDGTDADELFTRALERDVAFVPGSAFTTDPSSFRDHLRLSFATLDEERLRDAAARLADAWPGRPAG